MGEGDPVFSAAVKCLIKPELVMYAGLREMSDSENEIVKRLAIRSAGPEAIAETSQPVLEWIKERNINQLAIHFVLDVLDPSLFRSLLFAQPGAQPIDDVPHGKMTLSQVARLIQDISKQTDVVGISIAEHLPWDAINLHDFLKSLPIFD